MPNDYTRIVCVCACIAGMVCSARFCTKFNKRWTANQEIYPNKCSRKIVLTNNNLENSHGYDCFDGTKIFFFFEAQYKYFWYSRIFERLHGERALPLVIQYLSM